jgi:hypothetical protein
MRQCLVPTLKRGETVLMHNLPVHKVAGVAEAIEAPGATLVYLPKYSPESVALLRISARGNARTFFAMQAMFDLTGICSNVVWSRRPRKSNAGLVCRVAQFVCRLLTVDGRQYADE